MENVHYSKLSSSLSLVGSAGLPLEGDGSVRAARASELVGESFAMRRLRLQVQRIGPYVRSALMVGESGSGKSHVAAALHEAAGLGAESLVVCDVLTLEAAAGGMGQVGNGGALQDLADRAAGGSLLFEQIGEASPLAQNLVLRSMEQWDRERREGYGKRAAVRIFATSDEDLRVRSAAGRFRHDLYQRLATVQLQIPSLRERSEDIGPLAQHFLDGMGRISPAIAREFSEDAMEQLQQYAWPGNLRELENVVRTAALKADGAVIRTRHLPGWSRGEAVGAPAEGRGPETEGRGQQSGGRGSVESPVGEPLRLQDVIDEHVLKTLRRCAGNKLRAAEMLGVSRSTLYRMLDAASVAGRAFEM